MNNIFNFFKLSAAIIAGILGASVLSTSCSVIEDRDGCPNWLTLDFGRCRDLASEASDSLLWQGGMASETFVLGDVGYKRTYTVERGPVSIFAWMNTYGMTVSSGKSMIGYGHQSPEFWTFSCDTTAEGESMTVVVNPHKRFCRLRVRFSGFDTADSLYRADVTSTSCGEYLSSMSAVKGDFHFSQTIGADGEFGLRLPVQGFGDLTLNFYDADGKLVNTFDLSAILDRYDYDWTVKDLEDITITLLMNGGSVNVIVGDWYDGGDIIPESD